MQRDEDVFEVLAPLDDIEQEDAIQKGVEEADNREYQIQQIIKVFEVRDHFYEDDQLRLGDEHLEVFKPLGLAEAQTHLVAFDHAIDIHDHAQHHLHIGQNIVLTNV